METGKALNRRCTGCWGELPPGNYREALNSEANPWFAKMYGFHLLKIVNLSAEIT